MNSQVFTIPYRGALCGTPLSLLEKFEPAFPLSEKERKITDREAKMRLHTVRYETFERAMKRYGYTGRITDSMF